ADGKAFGTHGVAAEDGAVLEREETAHRPLSGRWAVEGAKGETGRFPLSFSSAHAAISAARGLRRSLKKGAREGRRAPSCPRSGPVEGVWGNREVPPARTCEPLTRASRRRATVMRCTPAGPQRSSRAPSLSR